ncbi:Threonine dehydrogenase [Paenibacillus sp. UNCCL117]|uniref:glucose 1-dehydrogenase n=1 Tax=unclassified Paenibacillus TaxID=185978 RepID=UPI00088869DE|nr:MULTISPECIES: glucose 1-dehydrogenase [unclassified Paenibacillus]SDC20069.1 Threonine dehydrogenase [Paenibacillus sp. cl123]SFW18544.1 Threonine dehydrogenase [Paenibacillus sp. UNCCL117]
MKAVRVTGLNAASEATHGEGPKLAYGDMEKPRRSTASDVLVRVLCVGLDGTDREIMTEKYGLPPMGEDSLVIGHESLGVVEEADPATGLHPGDAVSALVRRPCAEPWCVNCRNGKQDYCESGHYLERGIKGAHGYMSDYYVEDARYLVKVPYAQLRHGVLTEPQSIVEKVWDEVQRIQQRLVWQPKTAVILGSGPLGLLAALTCRCLGLETLVWSKTPSDSAAADIVRRCGATYQQADVWQAGKERGEAGGGGKGARPDRTAREVENAYDGETASQLAAFLQTQGKRADLIVECTGYSPLAFDAMSALGPNGVLALLGVTPGSASIKIPADQINRELVLENKCIVGSVNASRKDFETGLYRLKRMEELFPGVLDQLVTERLTLEQLPGLDFSRIGIKAVVDFVSPEQWATLAKPAAAEVDYSFSV